MLNTLKDFDLLVAKTESIAYVSNIFVRPTLINRMVTLQYEDSELTTIGVQLVEGRILEDWTIHAGDELQYLGRIMFLNDENLRIVFLIKYIDPTIPTILRTLRR